MYDVVVIGAGPSGAYTAYLIAKQGRRVLLCDRAAFPREKTCGGGISRKTVDLLEFDISSVVERRLQGAWLSYMNRDTVVKDLGSMSGVAVLRSRFDFLIIEQARSAGAEFRPSCSFESARRDGDTLEVTTSGGTFRTRYLIGADGVFSRVRSAFFGKSVVRYAPAVEAWIYVPPSVIESYENRVLFDFGGMPRGYGWIFPKADHLNVGVYSLFGSRDINGDLREFIAMYPSLGRYASIEFKGHAIPLKNIKQRYEEGNVWLVGDAAGFAESFYGEGIYYGLKSAVLAGRAMAGAFDRPGGKLYTDLLRKELAGDLRYSEINARLFFSFQKFGYYNMVRRPLVNDFFAGLITGEVGHRECFYRTLGTLPYWLAAGGSLSRADRTF
ncbi:MAG TPA: geranylgeranyl reductase family protein [Bacteroidota bacterium]|nr:geranylgeranyl reductase family protein [Bacteroidota bacterium]